jgi:2-keto-4-pentenoate hydratase
LLQARATARQLDPWSGRAAGLTLAEGYRVAALCRARRVDAGDTLAGRKIGFTNRQIWAEYGVWAPIWGSVYASTLQLLDEAPAAAGPALAALLEPGAGAGAAVATGSAHGTHVDTAVDAETGRNAADDTGADELDPEVSADPSTTATLTAQLAGTCEPRIEPEIVFGLAQAPRPGMSLDELLACVAWVAPGFELVHSLYPGWRFAAPDTVAAFGLHASLHVGPRVALPHGDAAGLSAWREALEEFAVELRCNGEVMDRGQAANVLDGPLHALRHLVELLGDGADPDQPPLAAGEVVTTGTLTRALPIYPGQRWTVQLSGLPLQRFSLWLR